MPRVMGTRWGRKSTPRAPGLASAVGRQPGQLLLHLGHVPVAADAVGAHALVDLAEGQLRLGVATGARHASLGVDHEVGDESGARQRCQRQDGGGGEAAGRPDDGHRGIGQRRELGAMQLRQPVHGLRQELRRGVLEAVPAGIVGSIAQPEVGPEVDDPRALRHKIRDQRGGGAVGEGQEDGVGLGQAGVEDEPGTRQVGVHRADRDRPRGRAPAAPRCPRWDAVRGGG